ncbi:glycerol-3-phosphate dehydrogenase [Yunchengibacter salinarum]|uniref:glycerol-3-phosphate dehydrogenase n=1 Tax=Yunchengibacter salinarum TaxID=3133399 RepID=UPI0035B60B4B
MTLQPEQPEPSGLNDREGNGPVVDLAVIGGGINGVGIARDAAGRGLSVMLLEKGDLGGATSSASTKLIHGGLRYLEHYEFSLVRHALRERDVLLAAAPHIVWPLRFVLPRLKGGRPGWMIRLGLFLYDHLGGRTGIPGSGRLSMKIDPAAAPLDPAIRQAFAYWDCWVQDNRLVVANARAAQRLGADIRVNTAVTAARRHEGGWLLETSGPSGPGTVRARAVVNAAGPWAGRVLGQVVHTNRTASLKLVKGTHIVTRRLFDHDSAYLFQNPDGRVIFAIPYERDYTLIGTTESEYDGALETPEATEGEIAYLLAAANRYFRAPIQRADVVWTYAGVRPLFDEGDGDEDVSAVTRDYVLDLDAPDGAAPLLNVFGGKLTTFRRLSEQAVDKLADAFDGMGPAWTQKAPPLPGGEAAPDTLLDEIGTRWPFVPPAMARRLVYHYGTDVRALLSDATTLEDLGQHFGADVYAAELAHGVAHEWVTSGDAFLWHRTKTGLRLDEAQRQAVSHWVAARTAEAANGSAPLRGKG